MPKPRRKTEYRRDIIPPIVVKKIPKTKPCAGCGKQRPLVAIEHNDEFCSTECAKKQHGVNVTYN